MSVKTWTGLGITNNFSEDANWSGGTKPQTTDQALFNGTSTKNCTIDALGTFTGDISLASGYTGIVTQGSGVNVSVGTFTQDAGTFTGAADATLAFSSMTGNGGTFNQGGALTVGSGTGPISLGGSWNFQGGSASISSGHILGSGTGYTLRATSGTWSVNGSVTMSAGPPTFLHNSGTINLTGSANCTFTSPSVTFNLVTWNKTGSPTLGLGADTVCPVGANPTITLGSSAIQVAGTFSGSGICTVAGAIIGLSVGALSGFTKIIMQEGSLILDAATTIPAGLDVTFEITSSTNRFFGTGGKTFGAFRRIGSGTGKLTFLVSATFTTFQDNDGSSAHTLEGSITLAATTFLVAGGSGAPLTIQTDSTGTTFKFQTANNIAATNLVLTESEVVGAIGYAGSSSIDGGGNINWLFITYNGPRTHLTELLDEILRIFDEGLRTTLSLKGVYRGLMAFMPSEDVTQRVNGIWVNCEPGFAITPIQLPSDMQVTYMLRIVYVRRININENVLQQREVDAKTITELVFNNFQMTDLTLSNGQVLWWLPTEVEMEPPEDGYVATLAEDLVAMAFKTEIQVRTRR